MELEEDQDEKASEFDEIIDNTNKSLQRPNKKRKLNNKDDENKNSNSKKNEFLIYRATLIDVDSDSDQDDETRDVNEMVEAEIRRYKLEKFSTSERENKLEEWLENPLKYWQLRQHKFPILAALSRRIFVIKPSQAPCESSFSLARFTLEGRKHQLSSKRFNDILYLNSIYKLATKTKSKSPEFEMADDGDDDDCILT